jgi:hypothetical protein
MRAASSSTTATAISRASGSRCWPPGLGCRSESGAGCGHRLDGRGGGPVILTGWPLDPGACLARFGDPEMGGGDAPACALCHGNVGRPSPAELGWPPGRAEGHLAEPSIPAGQSVPYSTSAPSWRSASGTQAETALRSTELRQDRQAAWGGSGCYLLGAARGCHPLLERARAGESGTGRWARPLLTRRSDSWRAAPARHPAGPALVEKPADEASP